MKLSIIIPVYNTEQYLCRCIDSVLAQTFADYELILIDDGSTDNSAAICDAYAKRDKRIIVLHISNGGQSNARNLGLQIARGDYLGFVDSDDYIDTQMYQCMFDAAEKNNADIVSCAYERLTESNVSLEIFPQLNSSIVLDRENFFKKYYAQNRQYVLPSMCNKIVRKNIFVNLKFPENKIFEDEYLIPYIYERSNIICICPQAFYKYIFHENSTMNRIYTERFWDQIYVGKCHYEFFLANKKYEQHYYAQDTYVSYFMKNYYIIYTQYDFYKSVFKKYKLDFLKMLPSVIFNPEICKMKKINLLIMFFIPSLGKKLSNKLFPECIINC